MSASTVLERFAPAPQRVIWPWLIDRRTDLLWISGGVWTGLALLGLLALGVDALGLWFVWVTLVDTPHFIGTYTRTYFDPEAWRTQKRLLVGSLGWLLAGPLALGVGYLLHAAGIGAYAVPWRLFLAGFIVWAYWHVIRQHWGIFNLYHRKAGTATAGAFARGEKTLLHAALAAPAIAFATHHSESAAAFGLSPAPAWLPLVQNLCWVFVGAFIIQQSWLAANAWRRGLSLNGAKLLFAFVITTYTAVVALLPLVAAAPLLAFAMLLTVPHDVQYDAIVWFYHRQRKARGVTMRGLAGWITGRLPVFLGAGIVMAVAFRYLGCGLELHSGCIPMIKTSAQPLFGEITLRDLLTAVFLGFPLNHYWLDQFIWRPSRDAQLAADLRAPTSDA